MKSPKKHKGSDPPCAELRPDDGIDPRTLFHNAGRRGRRDRKDMQLCSQAFRVFSLLLDQLSAEEWAAGLYLEEVRPAPDASRLAVGVAFYDPRPAAEALAALARLIELTGRFRWELGQAISRKRVPELAFHLSDQEADHEG